MPFEKAFPSRSRLKWDKTDLDKKNLNTIFRMIEAALEPEYEVRRSVGPGNIVQQIILHLHKADLVVADLSGLNPNVMYELGIRHSFSRRRTLLISQDLAELPFDLKNYYCVRYAWQNDEDKQEFRREVREQLELMVKTPDAVFGPVDAYLQVGEYAVNVHARRVAQRRLECLNNELANVCALCGQVISRAFLWRPTWFSKRQGEVVVTIPRPDLGLSLEEHNMSLS
jgi:hypothetical protein